MSDFQTDIWYERATDLIGYVSREEAEDLNAFKANIEDFAARIVELEQKYRVEREKDATAALRAAKTDMWPEPTTKRQDFKRWLGHNYIGDPMDADLGVALDEYESRSDYER